MSIYTDYMKDKSVENSLSADERMIIIREYHDFVREKQTPSRDIHFEPLADKDKFAQMVKEREEEENRRAILSEDEKEFYLYCFLNKIPEIEMLDKYFKAHGYKDGVKGLEARSRRNRKKHERYERYEAIKKKLKVFLRIKA